MTDERESVKSAMDTQEPVWSVVDKRKSFRSAVDKGKSFLTCFYSGFYVYMIKINTVMVCEGYVKVSLVSDE